MMKTLLLTFITVVEAEAREQVTMLDKIQDGNIINRKIKTDHSNHENEPRKWTSTENSIFLCHIQSIKYKKCRHKLNQNYM